MSEENKAIAARGFEVYSTGDYDIIDEVTSPDYVGHDPALPEPMRGPEALKAQAAGYRAAFSDLRLTVDQQIAEGEYVVTRWTGRGTHDGELLGVPPTGKSVEATGISIARIVDGKVVEDYTEWNALGLMQQVGAIPSTA